MQSRVEEGEIMSETANQSPADKIMQTYWDLFLEEQIGLEQFCRRLAGGEFGSYTKDQITDFLRQVEVNILQNIDTMLEANPHLAPLRDERIEETRQMIDDLVNRFGAPG